MQHRGNNRIAAVPQIMQMETLECGAAALAMVLASYGKWVPPEQLRKDCGVSRDGTNAKNIACTARTYGMEAKGHLFSAEALRQNGSFPCIIHYNFNHFVVLRGFRKNKAYINDPAKGSYAVPMDEFELSFSGICILLKPAEGFEKSGSRASVMQFAKQRLSGLKRAVILTAVTTLIASLSSLAMSGGSQYFIDTILSDQNSAALTPFTLAMAAIALAGIISSLGQAVYSFKLNGRMAKAGSKAYMQKLTRLPQEFFTQRMAGDIKARRETNAVISSKIINTIAPLALNTLMMVISCRNASHQRSFNADRRQRGCGQHHRVAYCFYKESEPLAGHAP